MGFRNLAKLRNAQWSDGIKQGIVLVSPKTIISPRKGNTVYNVCNAIFAEEKISFSCHIKRGGLNVQENPVYELVQFVGYFRM